jgi:hypothetical protein
MPDPRTGLTIIGRISVTAVRGLAFWTAALLPIVYIPLMVMEHWLLGNPVVFGKLVMINLIALVLGHGYGLNAS